MHELHCIHLRCCALGPGIIRAASGLQWHIHSSYFNAAPALSQDPEKHRTSTDVKQVHGSFRAVTLNFQLVRNGVHGSLRVGDNCVRLFRFNGEGCRLLHVQYDAHSQDVNCVAWHPTDPSMLSSCSDDGQIRLWKFHLGPDECAVEYLDPVDTSAR